MADTSNPPLDADYMVAWTYGNSRALDCVGEELWLAERQKSVGASVVAAACGLSRWLSPLKLWAQYRGEIPWPDETKRMRFGRHYQQAIGAYYEEETGRLTADPGKYTVYRNTASPWLHATLDLMDTTRDGPVEIKFVGWSTARRIKEEGAPPIEHQMQLQAQMHCTDKRWGCLAYQVGNEDFLIFPFDAHLESQVAIVRQTEQFWSKVKNGVPPEVTAADKKVLAELYPDAEVGSEIELLGEADKLSREFTRLGEEIKAREERQDLIRATVEQMLGANETGNVASGRWTWKKVLRKAYMVRAAEFRTLRFWPAKESNDE